MQIFKTSIITSIITSALAFTGDITSYGATLENQFCGFKKHSWGNQLTAAMNIAQIDNSASCGLCVSVDYGGKKTPVLIDNLCPECKFGDLDLSHEAWQVIVGNSDYSRLKASWEFIDCSAFITGNANGNVIITSYDINPWWLALTPSNFKCGVSEMYIMFESGDWIPLSIGSNMNGLYFIYHNPANPVNGKFKFRLVSRLGDSLETDWYSEIKKIFETGMQFECGSLSDCTNVPACPRFLRTG